MSCYPCPCPCVEPGYIAEPYHLPGYGGHIPTMKQRPGKSFGNASRDVIEDPCVAQAPCPLLAPPFVKDCCNNPCGGLRFNDPSLLPPAGLRKNRVCCVDDPPPCLPCRPRYDPRECTLNRGPYMCPMNCEPDQNVYRCCESMSPTYSGYIPGFSFNSTGSRVGVASKGTKTYMEKCLYRDVQSFPCSPSC